MTRVLLLVEGQTEEAFSNFVLRRHLAPLGVFIEKASLLRTKELPAGKPFKGGVTTYGRMARDVRRLLADTDAVVTTLIDYYGLPNDFPGVDEQAETVSARPKVVALETAFAKDIGNPRFRPFLMLHEFEAWVFAAADHAEAHLGIHGLSNRLTDMVQEAGGAELVNNGPATHPSKRLDELLQSWHRRYGKVSDGPEILRKAGLEVLRSACPHLDGWLSWIEALGQA